MVFLWPSLLWLLLILPLLVLLYLWLQRRKQKLAVRYASLAIVKEAMGKGPGWRRHLPPLHADPFDRLLLAQAQCEGTQLVTADRALMAYPAPLRWVDDF